jgi:small neutral amino acid transporter SnatA (MarC family)
MNATVTGSIMIAIGIVAIIGAALNWRIVSHSGKLLNRIFGDSIARAIYAAVGFVLVALGASRFAG